MEKEKIKNMEELARVLSEKILPSYKSSVELVLKNQSYKLYNLDADLYEAARLAAKENKNELSLKTRFLKMFIGDIKTRKELKAGEKQEEKQLLTMNKYLLMSKEQRLKWKQNANTEQLLELAKIVDQIKKERNSNNVKEMDEKTLEETKNSLANLGIGVESNDSENTIEEDEIYTEEDEIYTEEDDYIDEDND